jgi:splicing factor U2AF subunit
LKANIKPGEPILSAWISTDAHYAFVEFRSAEEANNGFQLNNISILGQPLRVGRPKTYSGMMTMGDDGGVCNTFAAALSSGTMKPVVGKKIQCPSRVLCFKNIVKDIDIENEDIFDEVRDDIKEECRRFGGQVESIFIPRKDVDDNFTPGMGNVYVMFDNIEEAKEVRRVNIY